MLSAIKSTFGSNSTVILLAFELLYDKSLVSEEPGVGLDRGLADDASAGLEVGPHLEVRLLPVPGRGIGVPVHLVEGELERARLVPEHVKPQAAPALVLDRPSGVEL